MKLKLLILLTLASLGVSAQSWVNFGANGIQRKVNGTDTAFRWNGGASGYLYGRSEAYYKSNLVQLNPSSPQSGNINLDGSSYIRNGIWSVSTNNGTGITTYENIGSFVGDGYHVFKVNGVQSFSIRQNDIYDQNGNTAIFNTKDAVLGKINLNTTPTTDATPANILTWDATTKEVKRIATDIIVNFVTPEQYGAIGDGVTDDLTAIQNAVNSGKAVYFGNKRYFISGTIELPEGAFIKGAGTGLGTTLKSTSDNPFISVEGDNITIESMSFLGYGSNYNADYTPFANPNQHGISIVGVLGVTTINRIQISNCGFYGVAGAGVYISQNVGESFAGAIQVSNCYAYRSTVGFFADVRGEYNLFTGNKAYECGVGFKVAGGNNPFVGGILSSNRTNLMILGGANNGHSVISGTSINHGVEYGIQSDSLTLGYNIADCPIYANDIYLKNSIGVVFSDCDISVDNLNFEGSTKIQFNNTKFTTTPAFDIDFNGSPSDVNFFNSKFWGAVPTSISHNQLFNGLDLVGDAKVNGDIQVFENQKIGFRYSASDPLSYHYITANGLTPLKFHYVASSTPTDKAFTFNTGLGEGASIAVDGSMRSANNDNSATGVVRNSDLAIEDLTTSVITSATLTSTYSDKPVGFKVICPNISGGGLIYTKSTTVWVQTPITVTP